jgi:TetR/AcrR family transcriptional regulator
MAARDTGTEQLIKDTAKQIFFAEGRFNATTQDIADAAGVARTVINYYFRSKEVLFKQVFDEAMADTAAKMDSALCTEEPLREKVIAFIDVFTEEISRYPYKESFFISEINTHGFTPSERKHAGVERLLNDVQEAVNKGEIKQITPINFLINMLSLVAYPLLTRRLFEQTLEMNDTNFEKLMQERKKMIVDLLFS